MKTTTLGLQSLAVILAGTITSTAFAVDAYSDPAGYYTLGIVGAADNVMSLPMIRDAAFAGTVAGSITATTFTVNAGATPPTWTANQWAYTAVTQPVSYYVEFTSGQLQGLFYLITANGTAGQLTLDTETDDLTNHPISGAAAALAIGDSVKIRPYWSVKDIFESAGTPIIEGRPNAFTVKDDILIPDYTSVATNKAPTTTIFYLNGQGWRAQGQGSADFGDFPLRPTEAFVVRRRNAATINLTNLGAVNMNRSISFVLGGNGLSANDYFISIGRPAAVNLDSSGLRVADQTVSLIKDSPTTFNQQDQLLAFDAPAGFNSAATKTYFYLAGQGWRQSGNLGDTTIGTTVFLEPGKAYIVRKKSANAGRDWLNNANY